MKRIVFLTSICIAANSMAMGSYELDKLFQQEHEKHGRLVHPSQGNNSLESLYKDITPDTPISDSAREWLNDKRQSRYLYQKLLPATKITVTYKGEEYTRECPERWYGTKKLAMDFNSDGTCKTLHDAVITERETEVDQFLAKNPDPNIKDKFGDTPLFYAFAFNARWMVRKLILAGADIEIAGGDGITLRRLANRWQWQTIDEARELKRKLAEEKEQKEMKAAFLALQQENAELKVRLRVSEGIAKQTRSASDKQ